MSDYEKNLNWAKQYIANSEGKLPNGMRIRIGNSDHEKETIVQITYQPSFGEPIAAVGATVELNQPFYSEVDTTIRCFFEEFRYAFNAIYKVAKGKEGGLEAGY